jgi:hypothetical protein
VKPAPKQELRTPKAAALKVVAGSSSHDDNNWSEF